MYAYPITLADEWNALYGLPPNVHMSHGLAPVVMSEFGTQTLHGEFLVRNIGQQHNDTTCVTPSYHRSPPLNKCEAFSPNMPDISTGSIAPALQLNYDYKGDVTVTTNSDWASIMYTDLNSEVESRNNYGAQVFKTPAEIYAANAAANATRGQMPNYSPPNYYKPAMLMQPGTGPRTEELASLRSEQSHAVGAGTNTVRVRTKEVYRRVYSENTLLQLKKVFDTSKFITIARKTELAKTLGLTERQVKIWFQNRRAKERRLTGKTPQDQPADSVCVD